MSRLARFALAGTLLTMLALLVPIEALHVPAAPLLVFVWPGVACACWLRKEQAWRDAHSWAIVLVGGLAFSPLLIFLSALVVPFGRSSAILLIAGAASIVLLAAPRSPAAQPPRIYFSRAALLLIAFPLLMVLGALLPARNEYRTTLLPLYVGFNFSDWYKHYGLTWEIEASGVPPRDLMFLSDPPQVQVYHIFFHLSTAMLDLLSDKLLGINFWLSANTLLAAAALLVALYALARRLWAREAAASASLIYASLLGGLDAIPNLANFLQGLTGGTPYFHTEKWAGCLAMTDTFFTAFTWVPQHVMALAILLLAWNIYLSYPASLRVTLLVALLAVSAAGFSIFVPVGALLGIGLFAGLNLLRAVRAGQAGAGFERAKPWLAAGLVAAAAALPLALYETSSVGATGEPAVSIWIRAFGTPHDPAHGAFFQWLFPDGGAVVQSLDLPLYYLFEIGASLLAAVIGAVVWSRSNARRAWLPGVFAAVASLLVVTFVRSNLGCNDLGMRGSYPLQAMVALWAGGGWAALLTRQGESKPRDAKAGGGRGAPPKRTLLLWALIIPLAVTGLATTAWQVLTYDVAKYLPAYDETTRAADAQTFALEEALRFIRTQLPPNIVFQVDPTVPNIAERFSVTAERLHFYTHDQVFNYQFPDAASEARLQEVRRAFTAPNTGEACSRFRAMGINVILLEVAQYAWTAGVDAGGGCIERRFEKAGWQVLELQ